MQETTTSGSTPVSQEQESKATVSTGSTKLDCWRPNDVFPISQICPVSVPWTESTSAVVKVYSGTVQFTEIRSFLHSDVWCEALDLYRHDFMQCTVATRLADWITAWMSRCTGGPNKLAGECILSYFIITGFDSSPLFFLTFWKCAGFLQKLVLVHT